ncbi:aldo/keto reductase [Streptomyces sp. NPDC056512]|uniref:aldo/keto reductase n=1 Tax=Streptomyces sp. NPDC056512 TaxID=3345846 RepID=UPI0036B5672B
MEDSDDTARRAARPRSPLDGLAPLATKISFTNEIAALENILQGATVVPHVNQLLVHAGNTLKAPGLLRGQADPRRGVLADRTRSVLQNAEVQAMAEKYGVSVPQLCIRYTLQLGRVSLPKTANPEHMRSNAEVDFEISGDDMDALRDLRDVDYGEHTAFPVYSGK